MLNFSLALSSVTLFLLAAFLVTSAVNSEGQVRAAPTEHVQGHAAAGVAREVRASHSAAPASLPRVAPGKVVRVTIRVEDATIEIAPGVQYRAWTFNGRVPGPVIHVRQGQKVEITFRNHGTTAHSLDFHAARIAANVAFTDIAPGASKRYSFIARDPGVFLYHCVTASALMHVANGMYGALVVDPKRPLPRADREFVLVASEWYLDSSGNDVPAALDMRKALAMTPDHVTFNGYANQYVERRLHGQPGRLVRFYVANAGPNLATPFHIVGGVFERVYADSDVTRPLRRVQTSNVAPGGGAIFDLRLGEPGLYPFVSHSFASVDKGEQGVLAIGRVRGTMSH